MTQDKTIEIEGTITSVLPGTMFHVALANNHTVLAHISGKMRKRFIRLLNGDRVKLEMSPYDLEKARIVYRLRLKFALTVLRFAQENRRRGGERGEERRVPKVPGIFLALPLQMS